MRQLQDTDRLLSLGIPHVDRGFFTHFTCGNDWPKRMFLDTRNFMCVTLIELLLLLEWTVKNGKSADVVDKVLMAHGVLFIIANGLLEWRHLTLTQSSGQSNVDGWVLVLTKTVVLLQLSEGESP